MAGKSDLRMNNKRDVVILAVLISIVSTTVLSYIAALRDVPNNDPQLLRQILEEIKQRNSQRPLEMLPANSGQKRLLFYNRPPKTGSTSVRVAMKKALDEAGMIAAKCFNMIEWNEMALRTIVNRRNVDFYGCHTRLTAERFRDVADMRGGNVTFMTSTRDPSNIIFSAYLQHHRGRNVAGITDKAEMEEEIKRYKQYAETYPVDALYKYHGAGDVPLPKCPYDWRHEAAMRRIAERYEIVIDLEHPQESAALVEIVTGLKPDFDVRYNDRTTDLSSPMLQALSKIDTSHRTCGNALVHKVLMQQFNVIKDRLLQNRCFNEDTGSFELCEKAVLEKIAVVERTRAESYKEKKRLQRT